QPANNGVKEKLSLFSGVPEEAIALLPNAPSIYQVPLTIEDTGFADVMTARLGLKNKKANLKDWRSTVALATAKHDRTLRIGFVAKYMDNADTYMSVFEALRAAAWHNKVGIELNWIDASKFDAPGAD